MNNELVERTLSADEYVEIRLAFGAEADERFTFTRVDVLPPRSSHVTSPG